MTGGLAEGGSLDGATTVTTTTAGEYTNPEMGGGMGGGPGSR
ncbi:hypothetical protein ACFSBZ_03045 [Amnibacterium flavum]|nr:hypothetical protein [Amnibacterium flavum]